MTRINFRDSHDVLVPRFRRALGQVVRAAYDYWFMSGRALMYLTDFVGT
jgi:hypothetical protein